VFQEKRLKFADRNGMTKQTPQFSRGLVPSAKSARKELFQPNIVLPAELEEASKNLPALPPREVNDDQPRYSVSLSPATVRVSKSDPRQLGKLVDNYKPRTPIKEWSSKSRSSMVARLSSLDYSNMLSDPDAIPIMATLTYPGDWETVVPDAETAKKHLRAFQKRYERAFGEKLTAIWKMEFQRRGAVHFHVFMNMRIQKKEFEKWLSLTWTEIVNPPDKEEKRKHLLAGTGVDIATGLKATDAKLVAIYFSKHNSPNRGSKEYQNRPPQKWLDQGSVGRFWGYWHLSPSIFSTEISHADALFISRTLRRWYRANAKSRKVSVWRTNLVSGEVKKRSVRRKPRRFSSTSGYLTVPNGAKMGQLLTLALKAREPRANGSDA
jgi:hypothetical protein